MDFTVQREKLDQAVQLLREFNIDMWLIFVRETPLHPDPCLDLVLGLDMTWLSAFIVTRSGERIAIVGRFDAENVRMMGGYSEVIAYDSDIFPELFGVFKRFDPHFIGVNFSEDDVAADGLSLGLWRKLNTALAESQFKHRLISAERLIGSLRGRKSVTEIQRIRAAVRETEAIINAVTQKLAPGQSALELHNFVLEEMTKHGVQPAWKPCPTVTPNCDAPYGHVAPTDQHKTIAGQLVHMDLGVRKADYVSDMQRVWYLKKPDEDGIPEPIQNAFQFVRNAIMKAADVLKPGVKGWEVDAAARKFYEENGYPEYQHAAGHHIGRSVHDGATVLGPRWARYGKTAEGVVEIGNIFTLELHVHLPEYGLIGLEEDVLVKENGIEWLSTPQSKIFVVSA